MFEFLKIQHKLNPSIVNEEYLTKMVAKGRITEEEKQLILSVQ